MKRLVVAAFLTLLGFELRAAQYTEVICAYAPGQDETVDRLSTASKTLNGGAKATLVANGLTAVAHSSGAGILTGSGGYLSGTMVAGTAAAVVLPVTVFVGGATFAVELGCAPKNHPELVRQVLQDAEQYSDDIFSKIYKVEIKVNQIIDISRDYWFGKLHSILN